MEKASGRKVFLLSGVSGKGVNDVLRAMAGEINQRRYERAERREARRPIIAAPTTRAERQSRNFNAPVVPKASILTPEPKVTESKKAAKTAPKPKPIKGKAKVKAIKTGALKPKAKKPAKPTGRAKAKAKPKTRTQKRLTPKKRQRR